MNQLLDFAGLPRFAGFKPGQMAHAIVKLILQPARILGMNAGHLNGRADADVCLFNPGRAGKSNLMRRSAKASTLRSTVSSYCKMKYTLADGQTVYQCVEK